MTARLSPLVRDGILFALSYGVILAAILFG